MLRSFLIVTAATTGVAALTTTPRIAHAADSASAAAADAAAADAADLDGRAGLEEVIVSARRRAENAQEVPIPITALTGGALDEQGLYRIEDLNERLPSL